MTKYRIIKNSEYTDPYFIQKQKRFLWLKWWVYIKEPLSYDIGEERVQFAT